MASSSATKDNLYDDQRGIKKVKKHDKPRLNDDWLYLDESKKPSNPTIDQKFNLNYKHQGIRNLKIEKPKKAGQTTDPDGNLVQKYNIKTEAGLPAYPNPVDTQLYSKTKTELELKLKNKLHRRKARVVNQRIAFWYSSYWLTGNMFFGLLALLGLSLLAGVETVATSDNFLSKVATAISGGFTSLIETVTGFDLEAFGFSMFVMPAFLHAGINLLIIGTVGLIHMLAGNKPLSGSHSSLKWGTFFIVLFGSIIPLFNLLPWVLLWLWVISKYPR